MNFFLSYGRDDQDFAVGLAQELTRLGVSVFDPRGDIEPGELIQQKLRQMLNDSAAVVLVIPKEGTSGANWAFFEAGAAKTLGKPILMVMAGGDDRGLPSELMNFICVDARKKPVAEVAKTLVHVLEPA